jgi:hypothetical protein
MMVHSEGRSVVGDGRRVSGGSWGNGKLARGLLVAPVYVAAAALLVIGVYLVAKGLQPGVTIDDPRPTSNLVSGFGALAGCFCLAPLGYFATKKDAVVSSLVTTAVIALVIVSAIALAAGKGANVAICLVLAVLFAYPAAIALVRTFGMRRLSSRQRSS